MYHSELITPTNTLQFGFARGRPNHVTGLVTCHLITSDKVTRCLKLWVSEDPRAFSIICFLNLEDQGEIKKKNLQKKKVPSYIMGKGWKKRPSNSDYGHPLHINFLRPAENRRQSSSQRTESPIKLYLYCDCFYSPQVMGKRSAHIIFCRYVQFTLCFSISAEEDTSVCLTAVLY